MCREIVVAVSCPVVFDFVTTFTVACQAEESMGFSRREYWSGLPFSSAGDLSNPGIKLVPPALAGTGV